MIDGKMRRGQGGLIRVREARQRSHKLISRAKERQCSKKKKDLLIIIAKKRLTCNAKYEKVKSGSTSDICGVSIKGETGKNLQLTTSSQLFNPSRTFSRGPPCRVVYSKASIVSSKIFSIQEMIRNRLGLLSSQSFLLHLVVSDLHLLHPGKHTVSSEYLEAFVVRVSEPAGLETRVSIVEPLS